MPPLPQNTRTLRSACWQGPVTPSPRQGRESSFWAWGQGGQRGGPGVGRAGLWSRGYTSPTPDPAQAFLCFYQEAVLLTTGVPAILRNLCILRSWELGSLLPEGSLKFHAISSSQSTNVENILISLLVVPSMVRNKMLTTIFIYTLPLVSITHLDNF